MIRPRRVIITTHGQGQYGHDTAQGILQFSAQVGHWDTLLELAGSTPACLKSVQLGVREWKAHAIVGELVTEPLLTEIRRCGLPVVNTSCQAATELPTVSCDHAAIGRMAARHFMDRHYRSFAFCGRRATEYSRLQEEAYRKVLDQAGFGCAAYPNSHSPVRNWVDEYKEIVRWIHRLPRPVALLACDDIRGRDVLLACERLKVRVPDDVAVLGSVNDTLLCSTCRPALASIVVPGLEIGYRAAELLQRLLHGGKPPSEPILLPPPGIVQRRSGDALAVEDPEVASTVSFIREHASERIFVADLLAAVPMSRRSLERKFRKALGRTPQEEILRTHLQEAESLLIQTDMKVSSVGRAAGFSNYLQFIRCFRRSMRMSPTEYRTRFRRSDSRSASALGAGLAASRRRRSK